MHPHIPSPRHLSYWKKTSEAAAYSPLVGETGVDAAVIGGGITGLTTALFLKRSGLRVAVLEAGRVGEGVTGYSTAKLTALHGLTYDSLETSSGRDATRRYAEANDWAIATIAGLVEELAIDCQLERHPALTYTRHPHRAEDVEAEVEAAIRAGLAAELVRDADLPFPIAAGIRVPDQATFHPLRYCLALAAAVHGDGSAIYQGTRAMSVAQDVEPMVVETAPNGRVRAPLVILACGLPFLDRGGFFARTHPSRSYCVALEARGPIPDSLSISAESPTRSIRPLTGPDGERLLLLAGEEHKVGQAEDTFERYERLEAFGRLHFPVGDVRARWSSQDYIPVDGLPLVGKMPLSSSRLFVATGFRKWGLTLGTAAARILTELAHDREDPWHSLFDAGRSQLPGGAGEAVKENTNVLKRFVGDRIRQRGGDTPDQLEPGEGAICELDGDAVAAFRNEEGELHVLSPVCTHMGCRVTWNPAERSWDCPCHGSRFTARGEVLTGPALTRLGEVEEPLTTESPRSGTMREPTRRGARRSGRTPSSGR